MTWNILPSLSKSSSKEEKEEERTWDKKDEKALQDLKRALRAYYSGENITERSKHLATLKMFGSCCNVIGMIWLGVPPTRILYWVRKPYR